MNNKKEVKSNPVPNVINDQKCRKEIARQSHTWFFHMYFSHYITYPTADFQKEFFNLSENESINPLAVMAFRGSAKSTIFTMSYPIWSILGKQQKKFVVLLGQTQRQAKQHLINLRRELEGNKLLKDDLGPFKEQEDEWGSYSLVLPWYNARITAASMEQTIRGMRHNQYRPDLIICDDIEDLASVKTKEGRDKIFDWISSEIIPAGDLNTRLVFIGNLLHEDSFLMRLKRKIEKNEVDGQFIEVPIIKNGKIMWPEKFKNEGDLETLRRKVGNQVAWEREYRLRIISTSERVVHPGWIHYYQKLPQIDLNEENYDKKFRFTGTGIDLAISQKNTADYTAMVSASVYGFDKGFKIYILPNPINKRLTFPQTVSLAKDLSTSLGNGGERTELYIEDVGYQQSLVQELEKDNFPAEGCKLHGQDKRSRLALTTHLIQNGTIVFPEGGCKQLISQLVNFGSEKHDDLADAFSMLINKIVDKNNNVAWGGFFFLGEDENGCSWPIEKN